MANLLALMSAVVLTGASLAAQQGAPPSTDELAQITSRGRLLAAYDSAASHATDAVQATHPQEGSVRRYIARETPNGWVVGFGKLNEPGDKFLVTYEATQAADPQHFTVHPNDPPNEDTAFYFHAAKAIDLAERDFKTQAHTRSYNVALLPAASGEMYVYLYPAQTIPNVYAFGGDCRYLVSADQSSLIEKRQMHKSVLEFKPDLSNGRKVVGGAHGHVLSDLPEDSDVFYVLSRKPAMPEAIATKNHIYQVQVDGTITIMK
jgi:hypothetical protein